MSNDTTIPFLNAAFYDIIIVIVQHLIYIDY